MENVLYDSAYKIIDGQWYCIAAKIPKGQSVHIVLKPSDSEYTLNGIGFEAFAEGWSLDNHSPDSVVIRSFLDDMTVNNRIKMGVLGYKTSLDFLIYENGAKTPIRIKTIDNL